VERRFKVTDVVIKYLSVRVDEDLKRAEKLKAMRAKQEAKRRRSKPAATPSGAGPSAPAARPPGAESAQA
ncbi:MAG: 30S ribosomal protein S6, partial [Acidobacteria bacterium]